MASKPTPSYYTPLPTDLTPEELNAIQYHRDRLDTGTYMTNQDGSPTTFFGARMGTPEGVMYFPTYWSGVKMEPRTALRMASRSGIKFPVYPNDEIAAAREAIIHGVMEADSRAFAKAKRRK